MAGFTSLNYICSMGKQFIYCKVSHKVTLFVNILFDVFFFQWDLVCSSEWMVALGQSTYMAGFMVGSISLGNLADM